MKSLRKLRLFKGIKMKDYEEFKNEVAFDEMLKEIRKTLKEFNFEQIKRLARVNECESFIEDDINELFSFYIVRE